MFAGFLSVAIFGLENSMFGLAGLLMGLPIGGGLYRFRSRNWPSDSSVRRKQIAILAYGGLLLLCTIPFNAPNGNFILVSISLFGSFAFAILLAGQRRL